MWRTLKRLCLQVAEYVVYHLYSTLIHGDKTHFIKVLHYMTILVASLHVMLASLFILLVKMSARIFQRIYPYFLVYFRVYWMVKGCSNISNTQHNYINDYHVP